MSRAAASVWIAGLLAVGCSRSTLYLPLQVEDEEAASVASSASSGSGGAGGEGGVAQGAGPASSSSSAGGFPDVPETVYVSTADVLWRIDLDALALVKIGPFTGCVNTVIDVAVDHQDQLFATTTNSFAKVDPATGACTILAEGDYPNSLCMVPPGTVDPFEPALVGFVGGTYVRIDRTTGAITAIGELGLDPIESSGDCALLPGGEAFLSVKQGGCHDCLVQFDPTTGAAITLIGDIGYSNVFGLATSNGKGFGFGHAGEAFRIDLLTAEASPVDLSGAPLSVKYSGATSRPELP